VGAQAGSPVDLPAHCATRGSGSEGAVPSGGMDAAAPVVAPPEPPAGPPPPPPVEPAAEAVSPPYYSERHFCTFGADGRAHCYSLALVPAGRTRAAAGLPGRF